MQRTLALLLSAAMISSIAMPAFSKQTPRHQPFGSGNGNGEFVLSQESVPTTTPQPNPCKEGEVVVNGENGNECIKVENNKYGDETTPVYEGVPPAPQLFSHRGSGRIETNGGTCTPIKTTGCEPDPT